MLDLVGNPNCWFFHAHAHIKLFIVLCFIVIFLSQYSSFYIFKGLKEVLKMVLQLFLMVNCLRLFNMIPVLNDSVI